MFTHCICDCLSVPNEEGEKNALAVVCALSVHWFLAVHTVWVSLVSLHYAFWLSTLSGLHWFHSTAFWHGFVSPKVGQYLMQPPPPP